MKIRPAGIDHYAEDNAWPCEHGNSFQLQKKVFLYTMNHNVTRLVEALGHKTEAAGSIPDGFIEYFLSQ